MAEKQHKLARKMIKGSMALGAAVGILGAGSDIYAHHKLDSETVSVTEQHTLHDIENAAEKDMKLVGAIELLSVVALAGFAGAERIDRAAEKLEQQNQSPNS